MIKALSVILILSLNTYYIPRRNIKKRDYIIAGHNTLHKINFETSSNFSKSYRGDKAIDNDINSSWISGNGRGPHWLEVDFGVKRLMNKIIIYPGKKDNYRAIKSVHLQFLYKNRWFDFAKFNFQKPSQKNKYQIIENEKAEIDLVGIDASAFRIYIPRGATYYGYAAIAEVKVYLGASRVKYFDERLKGLLFPVKNGFLPDSNHGYPNAPRKYRGGKHVGIDIHYRHTDDSYDPILLTKDTPLLSVDDGEVIRCDWDYKPMTAKIWKEQSKYFRTHPRTFVKRSFGGIQVWIDHKNGIVSAYNHLSKIDPGIKKGSTVKRGQRIGWAGNSGLYGEAIGKNYGIHLHYEIWVDGYYLGYGMSMKDIKKYINWIFFQQQ